jgi:hypothetical protein
MGMALGVTSVCAALQPVLYACHYPVCEPFPDAPRVWHNAATATLLARVLQCAVLLRSACLWQLRWYAASLLRTQTARRQHCTGELFLMRLYHSLAVVLAPEPSNT